VALVIVIGLVVGGTATARTIRTPITGSYYVVYRGLPERYWTPGPAAAFLRHRLLKARVTADDQRLTGIMCIDYNSNMMPSPDDPWNHVQGHFWGTGRLEADGDEDCENSLDYWEGTFVGDHAADGNESIQVHMRGYGAYAGLQVDWEAWNHPVTFQPFSFAGELMDPGGN
jgi:hypothetical protein